MNFSIVQAEIKNLEERLKTLNGFLDVRQKFPLLNHFTSKQCLILQRYFFERRLKIEVNSLKEIQGYKIESLHRLLPLKMSGNILNPFIERYALPFE